MRRTMGSVSRSVTLALLASALVVVGACGTAEPEQSADGDSTAPTTTGETAAPTTTGEPEAAAPQVEIEPRLMDLYQEAVDEGGIVTLYNTIGAEAVLRSVIDPFNEVFPDVDVELFATGSTPALTERILAEHAAGIGTADVIITGAEGITILLEEGILQPYDTPAHDGLADPALMVGPEKRWVATTVRVNLPVVNTNALPEDAWPTDWTDFAEPKPEWIGRIGMLDPRLTGAGYSALWGLYEHYGEEQADQIFEGLRDAEVKLYPHPNNMQQSLVAGEIDLTFLTSDLYPLVSITDGAPAAIVPMESGSVSYFLQMGIARDASHPAAAKLLYEWLISAPGQTQQALLAPSFPVRSGLPVSDAYPVVENFITVDNQIIDDRQEELIAHWIELMDL